MASEEKRQIERIAIYYKDGRIFEISPEDIQKAEEWARIRRIIKDLQNVTWEE